MKTINSIQLKTNSKEELLPAFSSAFPCITTKAFLNQYKVPWHWHKAVELFYIESGALEYSTPNGTIVFPQGSGGFVNSGILHTTKPQSFSSNTIQLLHLFDVSLLSGYAGSLIECKYITPLTTSPSIEILPIYLENARHSEILEVLKQSFQLSENEFGYELKLREALSTIWLMLLALPPPKQTRKMAADDKIKSMMIYIHDNYSKKIRVSDIAAAAFISERECYRFFNRFLHITPNEYLTDYRIDTASRLLISSHENITTIALSCGFGSGSLFGKVFREKTGYTPAEYRKKMAGF